MTDQEKLDLLLARDTIVTQQNRINELEQQIEHIRESQMRLVDKMLVQINELQGKVENLLDPLERTPSAQDEPNEIPNTNYTTDEHVTR